MASNNPTPRAAKATTFPAVLKDLMRILHVGAIDSPAVPPDPGWTFDSISEFDWDKLLVAARC